MANPAYDFTRFAPKTEAPARPQVRVVKPRRKTREKALAKLRTVGTVLCVLAIVALACGVLQTQTTIAQLQTDIAEQNKLAVEEEALGAFLTYELDSQTNLKNVEKRAAELGLVKMEKSQVTYVQAEAQNQIEVNQNALTQWLHKLQSGTMNMVDFLNP